MSDLAFRVTGAAPVANAATPTAALRVEIRAPAPVRALHLRCQVRIEPARRPYDADEVRDLEGLFGAPPRFADALRPLLWTLIQATTPGFDAATELELHLPCAADVKTGPGTYLAATAREGARGRDVVPLTLLFSGTTFGTGPGGALVVTPVPWSAEARFDLPLDVCRAAMREHHGEVALVALRADLVQRLQRLRVARAMTSLDDALALLLDRAEGS